MTGKDLSKDGVVASVWKVEMGDGATSLIQLTALCKLMGDATREHGGRERQ